VRQGNTGRSRGKWSGGVAGGLKNPDAWACFVRRRTRDPGAVRKYVQD
jgi:hypothetical protein